MGGNPQNPMEVSEKVGGGMTWEKERPPEEQSHHYHKEKLEVGEKELEAHRSKASQRNGRNCSY